MKKILYIALCSFCTMLNADDYVDIKRAIEINDPNLVYALTKVAALTAFEKQQLLNYAHQNTLERETEMQCFSHTVGLKRQALGILMACYACWETYRHHSVDVINLLVGILLYQWGKSAENHHLLHSKNAKIRKYYAAITIENLVEHATAIND